MARAAATQRDVLTTLYGVRLLVRVLRTLTPKYEIEIGEETHHVLWHIHDHDRERFDMSWGYSLSILTSYLDAKQNKDKMRRAKEFGTAVPR